MAFCVFFPVFSFFIRTLVIEFRVWTVIWNDLMSLNLSTAYALEKEMAVHSSILAWTIPWTERPQTIDCGLSGSFVYGILQARILQWLVISFSGGSSQPKNRTQVSCIAGRF